MFKFKKILPHTFKKIINNGAWHRRIKGETELARRYGERALELTPEDLTIKNFLKGLSP